MIDIRITSARAENTRDPADGNDARDRFATTREEYLLPSDHLVQDFGKMCFGFCNAEGFHTEIMTISSGHVKEAAEALLCERLCGGKKSARR